MRSAIPSSQHARLDVATTNRVLRNTYLLLAITLLPTIAGAFVGAMFPLIAMVNFVVYMIAFCAVLFGGQIVVSKYSHSSAGVGWLLAFTFAMGYFTGPLIGFALGAYSNGAELVAIAIGGTAAIFFTMAGYASTTKRDFSSPSTGQMLSMGMWMMFIIGIINVAFFESSPIALAVSSIFIVISSGFIVFTINRIVRGGETNYIVATLALYIMVLNIFQSLLHLLLAFAGNRE